MKSRRPGEQTNALMVRSPRNFDLGHDGILGELRAISLATKQRHFFGRQADRSAPT
jgi:hypothetical protein